MAYSWTRQRGTHIHGLVLRRWLTSRFRGAAARAAPTRSPQAAKTRTTAGSQVSSAFPRPKYTI